MNTTPTPIEIFFKTVSNFDSVIHSGAERKKKAILSQGALIKNLNKGLSQLQRNQTSLDPLSSEIDQVVSGIEKTINSISSKTKSLNQRLQLQSEYSERLIILVFGKVNAGKSSFSNYLVSLFQETLSAEPTKYFYFEEGKKLYTEDTFKVGSTETTARIQGVELGKIVLLDTPGLHSVTEINGNLTKKYTDSADLILWLSGSNSPGQTQELDELKSEINKGKVLFPIITKSDTTIEEIEVVGGSPSIKKSLSMKSPENQKLQQEDVYKRAKEKLLEFNIDSALDRLHSPISLSTHYANKNKDSLKIAGVLDLFTGLNQIYDLAIESKKTNVTTQVNNHINEINNELLLVIEPFKNLENELKSQKDYILGQSEYISSMVLSVVSQQIPSIVFSNEKNRNIKNITNAINKLITEETSTQLQLTFASAFKALLKATHFPRALDINIESNYEDETMSYEHQTGSSKKAVTSGVVGAGGAWGGAVAGAALGGPVGAVVGGILGGVFGGAAGDYAGEYFIETETITEVIGLNSNKIEAELNSKLKSTIPNLIQQHIESLLENFTPLENIIQQSIVEIEQYKGTNK